MIPLREVEFIGELPKDLFARTYTLTLSIMPAKSDINSRCLTVYGKIVEELIMVKVTVDVPGLQMGFF